MWSVTWQECKPYLEYQKRQILFREAIIHFLVGETEDEKRKRLQDEYCKACRQAKKDNCATCTKQIRIGNG